MDIKKKKKKCKNSFQVVLTFYFLLPPYTSNPPPPSPQKRKKKSATLSYELIKYYFPTFGLIWDSFGFIPSRTWISLPSGEGRGGEILVSQNLTQISEF